MNRLVVINGKYHPVVIVDDLKLLRRFLKRENYSSFIILIDSNTERFCLPKFIQFIKLKGCHFISIQAGEENKTLASSEKILLQLLPIADRKSVLINLGGGVITDLGGFTASVFKRGIDFINVPTTLLSMVDASIGGKTGVDFMNHKNQLGTFTQPKAVFILTEWLKTLPNEHLLSAYAEMAKQAMLSGMSDWKKFIATFNKTNSNAELITAAVLFKLKITDKDLFDDGNRKQLNFGHTIGHALESFCLLKKRPVPHGIAIAAGMICELYLSLMVYKSAENIFIEQLNFLINNFPRVEFNSNDIAEVLSFILYDKKNVKEKFKPVLLKKIGEPSWEKEVKMDLIRESLNYYLQL